MAKIKKPLFITILLIILPLISACGSNFTFRAEVLEFEQEFSLRNEESLLFVNSITRVGNHPVGGRYFISQNDAVSVLDANGNPISPQSIPPGTIVSIRFDGFVLESGPAIIPGAISIRVIE
ncbi:MAG: hypothetical protein FWC77_01470 [Defluviitaleaceae bacterium]|nr:hypothetical protein [Defluviitaleaceae bacterium]